ncbi:sulfotransferase [Mucilaginibacter sp.]|jgi:hypothetical protein|uniref:sulfotransferase n=1 Tax=Mucilaginibacter sp. TaxID=1882438 RepID=UPI002C7EBFAF|nr:sulfotransferase [Mucilaginibacter sp.]HTI58761.1 sulfotransferase [Mucilaginibacter sp.]
MSSQTLIIAGMHRSGTSLITNWLYHCGLQVGESLVEANEGNKEGHYEDVEFLKIHEEILADNGLTVSGLVYDEQPKISDYQLEKLKAIIRIKKRRFDQWGWKEPRTCLFLDTYRRLLPDARYLVIVRDYASVVNSLLKRDFDELDKSYRQRSFFTRLKWTTIKKRAKRKKHYRNNAEDYLRVWIEYNLNILSTLKGLQPEDYLVINYSLLQKDDRRVFSWLKGKWGFNLQYFSFRNIYKESLISRVADLSPYIKNEGLIAEAKDVGDQLKKYISLA